MYLLKLGYLPQFTHFGIYLSLPIKNRREHTSKLNSTLSETLKSNFYEHFFKLGYLPQFTNLGIYPSLPIKNRRERTSKSNSTLSETPKTSFHINYICNFGDITHIIN